jgi:FMN reductase
MRIAVRWLHGWAVPQQLAIGHVKEAFNEEQKLVDHSLQERLESLVEAVMDASMKLRA